MTLSQKIESYLFYTGEPISVKKLARVFDMAEGLTHEAVKELEVSLEGRGIVLVKNGDEIMLATHPEMSDIIQGIKKQELSDPLSKGAMETLAIILYKDGATKPEIDFIRGVNSQFMLRNLLVRGLIEKAPNEDPTSLAQGSELRGTSKRVTKYRATFASLNFLGITDISQLPHFEHFKEEMAKREAVEVKETNVFTE